MTASLQKTNQNTQEIKIWYEHFLFRQHKTVFTFSALYIIIIYNNINIYISASDKATNRQTVIFKQTNGEDLLKENDDGVVHGKRDEQEICSQDDYGQKSKTEIRQRFSTLPTPSFHMHTFWSCYEHDLFYNNLTITCI